MYVSTSKYTYGTYRYVRLLSYLRYCTLYLLGGCKVGVECRGKLIFCFSRKELWYQGHFRFRFIPLLNLTLSILSLSIWTAPLLRAKKLPSDCHLHIRRSLNQWNMMFFASTRDQSTSASSSASEHVHVSIPYSYSLSDLSMMWADENYSFFHFRSLRRAMGEGPNQKTGLLCVL